LRGHIVSVDLVSWEGGLRWKGKEEGERGRGKRKGEEGGETNGADGDAGFGLGSE
jgi:hypothetical protein